MLGFGAGEVAAPPSVAPRSPAACRRACGRSAGSTPRRFGVGRGLDERAGQVSTTIRWAGDLAASVGSGASAFLEPGPGRAVAEIAAGAHPDVPAPSLDDFRSVEGMREWLRRGGV